MKRSTWIASVLCAVGAGLTMIDLHGPPRAANAGPDPATADMPVEAGGRQPHAPPTPGEVRQIPIKLLGNFKYDPEHGGNIPADVRRLSGLTVRLTGFMIPMDQSDQVTRFTLVPGLFTCCYGQPPEIQHTVAVRCAPGKPVQYMSRPITVQGKLSVGETKEDGYLVSLFQMTCDSVQPAPEGQ
jgi:hypothetical protein